MDGDLVKTTERAIASSLLMGMRHADTKIELSDDFEFETSAENLPFEEAVDFFKSKVTLPKSEWQELEQKLRFRAFTVARLAECDFIEEARLRILHALEEGETLQDILADIKDIVKKDGSDFKAGYWETVFRTNIQSSYNAGRLMQYRNNMPPAWELLVIQDDRTSDICKGIVPLAGNGRSLRSDHLFWKEYGFPPYHFNCRTTFRAVYNYEIGKTTEVSDVPIEEIREEFKLQKGFGGNPIEKESWWRLTDSMKKRIEHYGIENEVEGIAHKLGIENYDIRLANNEIDKKQFGHTTFNAQLIKGAEPKPHEIEIAKILEENGHKVLFTPENTFDSGIKNPEGIETSLNKILEMKRVTSPDLNKLSRRMKEAAEQNAEIAVLYPVGTKDYSEEDAVKTIKHTFEHIVEKGKQVGAQKSVLEEVWLIWDGKLCKIKK